MKKTLPFLCFVSFLIASWSFALPAVASHEASLAAELTYTRIGTDTLAIKYRYYRNCAAPIGSQPTVMLAYRAVGCHTGGNIVLTRTSTAVGQPLCGPAVNCQQSNKPNYIESVYAGYLVLPAACSNWVLSVTNDARLSNNLISFPDLYTDLKLSNISGVVNTSPVFGNRPAFMVCQNQSIIFNQNATDAEGDSLVYSLVTPMSSATAPVNFLAGFSATSPFGAAAPVTIDQVSGALTFNPNLPIDNGYAFRVKVTEYRSVNGTMVNIGETHRDMYAIIFDCPPANCMPALTSPLQPLTSVFEIPAGTSTCLDFKVVHTCDSANFIMRYDTVSVAGVYQIIYNGRNIRWCWSPGTADIRPTPYNFNITLGQNTCPMPSFVSQTIQVQVVAATGLAGLSENISRFTVSPNPFTQEALFTIQLEKPVTDQQLIIYNMLGQEVDRLALAYLQAGENTVQWNKGAGLKAGAYLARLTCPEGQNSMIRFIKMP